MATMADVASRAGVSVSTVSHVFNRTRFVSRELAERIHAAAAELGYRHNAVARSLRTGKTHLLALIIPDVSNPYYPEVARGVQDAADARDYAVVLCNTDRRVDLELRFLEMAESRQFDGVVLDPAGPHPSILATLRELKVPVVLVGSRIDEPAFDRVLIGAQGAYAPVRHLLAKGHRRIALIGGPPSASGRPAKATGYLAALADAGVQADERLMVQADYTRAGGAAAMRALLSLGPRGVPRFTAVFAANDLMAIGALDALREAGLRVPEDVAVAGYDDIAQAAFTTPALTTVAVPKYELGKRSVELLLDRIGGSEGPPRRVELPHTLVIRSSA